MCGINGFSWKDRKKIEKMNGCLTHRGPDDKGIFVQDEVSLGQTRLSILDLSSKGHQPMGLFGEKVLYSEDELRRADLIIVFNGEVYNFLELKERIGGKFSTKTDTEVILRSYQKWGRECVHHFNGMWSFVIFDRKKNQLFCSRDRLGVKPFYYYFDGKEFVFSSEMKGILEVKKVNTIENISREAIEFYFSIGYIPAPYSIFNNVHKLEAGHNITFDLKEKKLSKQKWYDIPNFKPTYDKKKLIEEGRELLKDAVRLRLIADVPVGAFLSGGLDSSAVVGEMSEFVDLKNLHTFSIGFEGKYDETKYVNIVKDYFKTKHHHYYFKEKDFEELIGKYVNAYDEPFGDYSGFPTLKVSELAKKEVSVVLSGDGGDEIFGGYNMHKMGAQMELLRKVPVSLRKIGAKIPAKKNLNSLANLFLLKEAFKLSLKDKNVFYTESISEDKAPKGIFKEWSEEKMNVSLIKGKNNLAEALRIYDLLFNTLADNFLVKVDRASMNFGLEVRSPFLDYRLVEFSQKIPTKWKTTSSKTKVLMREIIEGVVPKEIINRGKQGFEPPLKEWLLKEEREELVKGVELVSKLHPQIGEFMKKVMSEKEENNLHSIYKIRLFLLMKWSERWLS